ncbi:MAG: hypothetical protein Q8908_07370, partial [Bacteroidota bacterium]|nr:hypothetical protein [Bacteroidota bacterium]
QSMFPSVILEDHMLNISRKINPGDSYPFQASKSDNVNRFVLNFGSPETLSAKGLPARIYEESGRLMVDLSAVPKETTLRVCDIMGRSLLEKQLQPNTLHSVALNCKLQIVIVTLLNKDGYLSRKLLWSEY